MKLKCAVITDLSDLSKQQKKMIHNVRTGVSDLVFLADNYEVKTIKEVLTIISMDRAKRAEMQELFGCDPAGIMHWINIGIIDRAELDTDVAKTVVAASKMNLFAN